MPLVVKPSAFTCRAERLARARASPHGSITRPSGKVKGVSPAAEASEKMTLGIAGEFVGSDIFNAPRVDDAARNLAGIHKVLQPCGAVGIDFVVVDGHRIPLCFSPYIHTVRRMPGPRSVG